MFADCPVPCRVEADLPIYLHPYRFESHHRIYRVHQKQQVQLFYHGFEER
jgi:hypothetical protein